MFRPATKARPAQSDAIAQQNRKHTATARDVFEVCVLGAVILLLFCAHELPAWAERQWPALQPYAEKLDTALSNAGLDAPYDAVHSLIQRLAEQRFGG